MGTSQKGKDLNYVPPSMRNGNFMVELVEVGLTAQDDIGVLRL